MSDWTLSAIRCPLCQSRSTYAGAADHTTSLVPFVCMACNARWSGRGDSFVNVLPYAQLSEHDQQRVRELRRALGYGGPSAVGAFG